MRRRAGAAILLCGPLLAGCGTAARLDFSSHSRPASPVDVSVYVGAGRPLIDPRRIQAGPVQFNLTNQTPQAQVVAIALPDGRVIARTSSIPPRGTAQLKADLTPATYGVGLAGRTGSTSVTLLRIGRPARSGNGELSQP